MSRQILHPRLINRQAVKPAGKISRSLSFSAILMMAGLFLSKLTGQLREILIIPAFNYGNVSDAYIMGFQIPDLFFQLLVGGAIQAAITPTLAAAIEKKQIGKGWRSISIFINLTALVMLVSVVAGELLTPLLIPLFSGNKPAEAIALAVQVTRALFPQVFFMMLAALCIGILNAYKKFASTSFGPSIYNIFVVLSIVLFGMIGKDSPYDAVRVASGVMVAACIYFLIQFYLARREFRNYVFSFDYRDRGFRRLLNLAIPTLISGSIVQLNAIILTGFANWFEPGIVSSLRQASTTWQLPYGIFAVAIGNVMLPSLAGFAAVHDDAGSRRLFLRSLRSALFLVIPSAGLFLAMQQDVIRAIFQWESNFTALAVANTAKILSWYCLAMVAQTVIFLVNQAFYARRMTKIALYNGLLTLILNSLLCLALIRGFKMGAHGLSLAYAITSCISAVLLYTFYRKLYPSAAPQRIWPFLAKSAGCVLALLLVTVALSLLPVHPQAKILQLLWFGLRAAAGLAAYMVAAIAMRMPEPKEVMAKILGRLGRQPKQA